MAENPILNSDFYNGNGKPFEEVIKNILQLEQHMMSLVEKTRTLTQEMKAMASPTTSQQIKEQVKVTKELEQTEKEMIAVEKERVKLEIEMEKLAREQVKTEQQKNKATKEATGEYKKQSDELNKLRKQYKDLAAEEKENTKEAKALLKQITDLDKKLKEIDATVGQHQRNVGNYKDSMTGLTSAIGKYIIGIGAGISISKIWSGVLENVGWISKGLKVEMAGVSAATGEFFAMLGNLDFKNFVDNMINAYSAGKEYASAIMAVNAAHKALEYEEARNSPAQAKRLIEAKKRSNDIKTRKDNIEVYLKVAKEEADIGIRIANQEVKANGERIKTLLGLNEEQAKWFLHVRATNPELEKQANSLLKVANMSTKVTTMIGRSMVTVTDPALLKKQTEAQNILNNSQEDYVKFARIKQTIMKKDPQLFEDMRLSLVKQGQAMAKFDETTRRAQKTYDEVILAINENAVKRNEEALKKMRKQWEDFVFKTEDILKNNKKKVAEDLVPNKELGIQLQEQVDLYKKTGEQIAEAERQDRKRRVQENFESFQQINQQIQQYGALALDVIEAIGNFQDAQYNRDISAAGNNAKKKEQIEKEYAKKRQNLAVGQAIVNGALSVSAAAINPWPMPALAMIAIAAAKAASEVAVIKSVKFAKGGSWIEGGRLHSEGGNNYGDKELERGERVSVFSRSATAHYGDTLEHLTKAVNDKRLDLFSLNFQPKPTVILNNDQRMLLAVAEKQLAEQRKTTSILSKTKTRIGNTTIDSNGNKTIHV